MRAISRAQDKKLAVNNNEKTMLAEAFAGMMHVPLLSLSMAKIFDHLVGSSEKRIDSALKVARSCAPCVLLMDELEKSVGGIASSNNTDSGITSRVVKSILEFLQDNDSGVYVIMTSNDVSQLPPELTRSGRLDAQWYFGLPKQDEREEVFRIHLHKRNRTISDSDIQDAAAVAKDYTGAEIEQAVKNAMRISFKRSRTDKNNDITLDDLVAGIHEVTPVSHSSREKIAALEAYCRGRARRTDEESQQIREEKEDEPFSIKF